jgi:hypothetical protein
MQGVSKRALQWYSKYGCVVSVKAYKLSIIQHLERRIVVKAICYEPDDRGFISQAYRPPRPVKEISLLLVAVYFRYYST